MDLNPLFAPASLAVCGVSLSNDRHPANVIYNKNLLRFPVTVYPVNPRGGTLRGEKVYTAIDQIENDIDLAVIALRAELVPETLQQCISKKVKGAVVISGGFAEAGRQDLQEQLLTIATRADFPFIGPNCLGIYAPSQVDTFFLPSERMIYPDKGNVAVISQSGGILVDLLVKFAGEGIGLSLAVSIGNKALVKEEQLLQFLANDPATSVIAFYIEGFGENEGRKFVNAARKCQKPVIVMKAGKTHGGQRAVSSHTASLAGDYKVLSDIFAQYGIVEAKNELELLSFCESLSSYQNSSAKKIGIITSSGGHGAMAVDACLAHGLEVPMLPEADQHSLRESLSPSIRTIAALGNPIDLTGSAVEDDFATATSSLFESVQVDCVLILLLPYLPGISSDLSARISQLAKKADKPLIAYVPHVEKYRMLIDGFEFNQVPVSPSIEGAVLMVEALHRRSSC
ncbi:MAG: CoA-binding protein [Proteobacteria bacterium]|nr:CoA-binding protein [Pseudomonadota bacterium]MBU1056727.1 CoA-binding protein [Pseudomonadota bacterium]